MKVLFLSIFALTVFNLCNGSQYEIELVDYSTIAEARREAEFCSGKFRERLREAISIADPKKSSVSTRTVLQDSAFGAVDRIEKKAPCGYTILMEAVCENKPHLIPVLVKGGFSLDARDEYRRTAAMLAAKKGHTAVLKQIAAINPAALRATNDQTSVLCLAAINGHKETTRYLLSEVGLKPDDFRRSVEKLSTSVNKSGHAKLSVIITRCE
jgi:ankyrin repeat protein